MTGGRGAKGSIKDRLLSILYRIRYMKALKKKKALMKKNKPKVLNIVFLKSKIKLEKTKKFTNNKKQENKRKVYYIKRKKVGIGPKETNITKKSPEIKIFVVNSNLIIKEIKKDIEEIKKEENVKSDKLLNQKIILLSNEYYKFKNKEIKKYDFEKELSILKNIKNKKKGIGIVEKTIDNYQIKLNSIEKEKKKEEPIVNNKIIYYKNKKKKVGIGPIIEKKKLVKENEFNNKTIKEFKKRKEQVKKIDDFEENLKKEVEEQKRILKYISSKSGEINTFVKEKIVISGISKIFSSILRIALGILTLPFSGKNMFGVMLGSGLINKGIRGIRKGLKTNKYNEITYNYEDLAYKIKTSKNKLGDTKLIIEDSIDQLDKLKDEFKDNFYKYNHVIPEYEEVFKKIDKLEESLNKKKKEIYEMDKRLNKQYEINKVKLKKVGK